jgi:hypothetical protein
LQIFVKIRFMGWKLAFRDNADIPFDWRVKGFELIDSQDKVIAPVHDLLVDESSGEVRYVAATMGGLMGIKGKALIIPAELITKGGAGTLMVSASNSLLNDAPWLEDFENPSRAEEDAVFRYFGLMPYWAGAEEPEEEEESGEETAGGDSADNEDKDS